jgi:hypothetical protein
VRASRYAAIGRCILVYEQLEAASFDDMRNVLALYAELVPSDFCRYPAVRVKFKFGVFAISCIECKDAVIALSNRFRKPVDNNISGFRFPSKKVGHSKKNAVTIDDDLLEFTL